MLTEAEIEELAEADILPEDVPNSVDLELGLVLDEDFDQFG